MSLYAPGAKCREPGCDEPPGALGLCPAHKAANRASIQERLNPKPPPRKPSTGRPRKRYVDPLARRNQSYSAGATCKVDGCDNRPGSNWLCPKHHMRLRRHGDVHMRYRQRVAC